jgi:hypothetical protein
MGGIVASQTVTGAAAAAASGASGGAVRAGAGEVGTEMQPQSVQLVRARPGRSQQQAVAAGEASRAQQEVCFFALSARASFTVEQQPGVLLPFSALAFAVQLSPQAQALAAPAGNTPQKIARLRAIRRVGSLVRKRRMKNSTAIFAACRARGKGIFSPQAELDGACRTA